MPDAFTHCNIHRASFTIQMPYFVDTIPHYYLNEIVPKYLGGSSLIYVLIMSQYQVYINV